MFFFAAESSEISTSAHKALIYDCTSSQPTVVELLDVSPLTGELGVCDVEASSKVKQYLKELTTDDVNEEKSDGPQISVEQEHLKEAVEINERKRRHVPPRTFSPEIVQGKKKPRQTASRSKKTAQPSKLTSKPNTRKGAKKQIICVDEDIPAKLETSMNH